MLHIRKKTRGEMPTKVWNKEVLIPTMREALVYHHQKHIPKHFTAAGAEEYKYMARKGDKMPRGTKRFNRSYVGRKLKKYGHTRPLEFSGTSKRLTRVRDVRVTSKRGRLILPPGFNRKHPKSRIRMRDEITAVPTSEEAVLTRLADRSVTEKAAAIKTRTNKKLA